MEDQGQFWSTADLIRRGLFDSVPVIQRLVRQGRFPAPRKIAGRAMWRKSVVEQWVRDQPWKWIPRRAA